MKDLLKAAGIIGIVIALVLIFKPQSSKLLLSQFDKLMGETLSDASQFCAEDFREYAFYKDQYLKGVPFLLKSSNQTRIPKVLHFIWLGPAPFPEESVEKVLTWQKYHSNWTIKFWTDDPSRPCPTQGMQKQLIQESDFQLKPYYNQTKNWGEKSDLLRYEILYREGGIYVDHDIECFRSFDPLLNYNFFAGIEPFENIADETKFSVGNCLIGATPHHPILKGAIEFVKANWQKIQDKFPQNDSFSNLMRVLQRTFIALRVSAREHLGENGSNDIILPPTFFFAPYLNCSASLKQNLKAKDLLFAFHRWDGLWMDDAIIKEIRASKKQEEIESAKMAAAKISADSLKKLKGILGILQAAFFLTFCALIAQYFKMASHDK